MTRTLYHLSLTTGSARHSPRAEVSDEVIDRIRTAIAETDGALSGTGWRVRLIPAAPPGCHAWDLERDGRRVVTCLLCDDDGSSAELWRLAETIPGLPGTVRQRPDAAPWLAVALVPDQTLLSDPLAFADVLTESGDLERCVAWALID